MLQAHERLGDFEIVRLLGKGGMGEVYEALQFNPERRVALKVLAPWLATDEDALQRFWREARVPANLDHPGIVRIISTGKTPEGVAYYTMHLVRGVSLAELIRRANAAAAASDSPTRSLETVDTPSTAAPPPDPLRSPAPVADSVPPCLYDYRHNRFVTVARIGVQAARALAYAHEQGHLHRDIKPSNLMVDVHNHVYLVDFGLTRALQPAGDGTQSGALVGTPWYMSPEQADGNTLDERSDIYSLGVALFELATQGLGPFTASRDNKQAVLAQVRAGQVLPLRTLAPGIPPALEQIILRAMQHKPKRRYASAADMAQELEAILGQPPKRSAPVPRQLLHLDGRRWLGVAAGLVLAVLLVTGAVVYLNLRAPAVDDREAMPENLRRPVLNLPLSLIKANHKPLWGEVVFGKGQWYVQPGQSGLNSPIGANPTLLALADPKRPCFKFAVQLMQIKGNVRDHEIGVFFGWQRDAAGEFPRLFVIQLDEFPTDKGAPPRIRIGTAWAVPAKGDRGEAIETFKPLPDKEKAAIPLSQVVAWHTVTVWVQHEKVVVTVDNVPSVDFSMPWLRQADQHAAANLQPSGAVGIWTRNGPGLFKNATLTALPGK